MKSYHANSGAGIAGLTVKEHDEPKPGPREVLIRLKANSLNFRELMVLRGNYPLPVKPEVVMGADGAGEVVAAGGGPVVGRIALRFIVEADSLPEVDKLISSLPIWPLAQSQVTPLVAFEHRRESVQALLENLKVKQ